MNQKSADINAGEFTAIEASEITFINNLAYGRPEKHANTQDGSTVVIWSHNLFVHAADVLLHDGIVEADPRFVAPASSARSESFRLRPGSPALGAGPPFVAPPTDLAGAPRPASGSIDLGAYQHPR